MDTAENGLKDVVGIGNAIVDILAHADDEFLARHVMAKGAMTLVDAEQAARIYEAMGPTMEQSGGSVGNTMAGIAALGGTGSYIGKVRDDPFGAVFRHDLHAMGISTEGQPAHDGQPTGRCLVVVTPDGERTMATHLGACVELESGDIEPETIRGHQVVYLEGYLWDLPQAKAAMVKAAEAAHAAQRRVALTLSDPFCVDRHRDSFKELVRRHVDVLFANEDEIISLYQARDFEAALQRVRGDCKLAAVTRSEKGSVIAAGGDVHVVDAVPVERVVDATGAGDLYAAGFLYGLTHGYDLPASGRIGAAAASEIIGHMGARPEADLRGLAHRMR